MAIKCMGGLDVAIRDQFEPDIARPLAILRAIDQFLELIASIKTIHWTD